MKPATLDFVKKLFGSYYAKTDQITLPENLPVSFVQREFGFLFFSETVKPSMSRHMAFSDADNLHTYLKTMVPAHVYYSTAFYTYPSAPNMEDKGWQGAELIFDLDADHILHAAYEVMLSRVKEDLFKLIEMLTEELGFDRRSLHINFSGGRGYHIHITDESVRRLGSEERRELSGYVSGTGISADILYSDRENFGWKQRYFAAAKEELERIAALPRTDAQNLLLGMPGFTEKTALLFARNIPVLLEKLQLTPSSLKDNTLLNTVLNPEKNPAFREKLLARAAQTDEPVTTDIKRLIRYPGSLHGGSGMRVVPIDISRLDAFDPLIDAVVFDDTPVTVTTRFPLKMSMLGNTYDLEKGVNTVPQALGVFLCCRGIAEYGRDE